MTWDSFAWGGALGMAACLGTVGALTAVSHTSRWGSTQIVVAVFLGAFVYYEIGLYAASLVLPGGNDAFSVQAVWRIFYVNAIALTGLLLVHRLAMATGLVMWGGARVRKPAARVIASAG
jgi:hypothetical protein